MMLCIASSSFLIPKLMTSVAASGESEDDVSISASMSWAWCVLLERWRWWRSKAVEGRREDRGRDWERIRERAMNLEREGKVGNLVCSERMEERAL